MSIFCRLGIHDTYPLLGKEEDGQVAITCTCSRCRKEIWKEYLPPETSQTEPEKEPPAGISKTWLAKAAYEAHKKTLGLTSKKDWEAAPWKVQIAWIFAVEAVLERINWFTNEKEKNDMEWDRIKQQLIEHEGQRLTVYDDYDGKPLRQGDTIKGHPTIGVGRCLDKKGISHAEAMILLDRDINECVIDMERTFPNWPNLTDARQHALIDMRFNLGMAGFLGFERFISAVKDERWLSAGTEMADSKWFHQVKGRAVRLKQMIETGEEVPR